jgi:hypothetical protein
MFNHISKIFTCCSYLRFYYPITDRVFVSTVVFTVLLPFLFFLFVVLKWLAGFPDHPPLRLVHIHQVVEWRWVVVLRSDLWWVVVESGGVLVEYWLVVVDNGGLWWSGGEQRWVVVKWRENIKTAPIPTTPPLLATTPRSSPNIETGWMLPESFPKHSWDWLDVGRRVPQT